MDTRKTLDISDRTTTIADYRVSFGGVVMSVERTWHSRTGSTRPRTRPKLPESEAPRYLGPRSASEFIIGLGYFVIHTSFTSTPNILTYPSLLRHHRDTVGLAAIIWVGRVWIGDLGRHND